MNWIEYWDKLDAFLTGFKIEHFSAREISQASVVFSYRRPIRNKPAPEKLWNNIVPTLLIAEAIRHEFQDVPVIVNSGYRSPAYNRAVGGAKLSQHVQFRALDIMVSGVSPPKVFEWMELHYPDRYGRGLYRSFVHIDTRPNYARWGG